jgi:hypothetical protein
MYAKPMPEPAITKAWIAALAPYPLHIIEAAMRSYCEENGEFAPVPASIATRCKLMDGRPGAEEAWAIALTSRDQNDTVVWTTEIAEAFSLCEPVLELGDEVGARMAFKEAYQRLTTAARAAAVSTIWIASLGWDSTRRPAVLSKASNAGLLPVPTVTALLPLPTSAVPPDTKAHEQLEKIKQMLASGAENRLRKIEARANAQRQTDSDAKYRLAAQTQNYLAINSR